MNKILLGLLVTLIIPLTYAKADDLVWHDYSSNIETNNIVIPEELQNAHLICEDHKIYDMAMFATNPPTPSYHYEDGYEDCYKLENKINDYNSKSEIQKQKDIEIIKKAIQ